MSAIDELHEASGLSWSQLAKVVGVSVNALMMWSRGGVMNADHAKIIDELSAVVAGLEADTPGGRAAELFRPRRGLRSLYDDLVEQRYSHRWHGGYSFRPVG